VFKFHQKLGGISSIYFTLSDCHKKGLHDLDIFDDCQKHSADIYLYQKVKPRLLILNVSSLMLSQFSQENLQLQSMLYIFLWPLTANTLCMWLWFWRWLFNMYVRPVFLLLTPLDLIHSVGDY
jgi:hypothetical protein